VIHNKEKPVLIQNTSMKKIKLRVEIYYSFKEYFLSDIVISIDMICEQKNIDNKELTMHKQP